jgi:hypothetical protein
MWYEDPVRRSSTAGVEWLAVIGVSTVPHELKAVELPLACGQTAQGTEKTGNPAPFQNSPASPRC